MRSAVNIMGILNLTPDSFSDGGQYQTTDSAMQAAMDMVFAGANIIDIGGESTRPGAERITIAEQKKRVIDVIYTLRQQMLTEIKISIDSTRAEVAEAAIDAGAMMINDVSAGRDDPDMFALAAERDVDIVLMHMQGTPQTMQDQPYYLDVVNEVRDFLLARAEAAMAAGVDKRRIIIDPGIGFGKTQAHNLRLISSLVSFVDSGFEVLLGASRKRFMGDICAGAKPHELVGATVATTVLGVAAGVRMFRVHDVRANRQAADTALAILTADSAVLAD